MLDNKVCSSKPDEKWHQQGFVQWSVHVLKMGKGVKSQPLLTLSSSCSIHLCDCIMWNWVQWFSISSSCSSDKRTIVVFSGHLSLIICCSGGYCLITIEDTLLDPELGPGHSMAWGEGQNCILCHFHVQRSSGLDLISLEKNLLVNLMTEGWRHGKCCFVVLYHFASSYPSTFSHFTFPNGRASLRGNGIGNQPLSTLF